MNRKLNWKMSPMSCPPCVTHVLSPCRPPASTGADGHRNLQADVRATAAFPIAATAGESRFGTPNPQTILSSSGRWVAKSFRKSRATSTVVPRFWHPWAARCHMPDVIATIITTIVDYNVATIQFTTVEYIVARGMGFPPLLQTRISPGWLPVRLRPPSGVTR